MLETRKQGNREDVLWHRRRDYEFAHGLYSGSDVQGTCRNIPPVNFDTKAIVSFAKDAGMKYIVTTSKHHDGFAMYHSKANEFNIVDATLWKKDPMKELAAACRAAGLGFGFYYSHNQNLRYRMSLKHAIVARN